MVGVYQTGTKGGQMMNSESHDMRAPAYKALDPEGNNLMKLIENEIKVE